MPSALVPLATLTLSSTQTSVTFSSISGSYRDLLLVINKTTSAGANTRCTINSDSGSNYSFLSMSGTGGSTFTATNTLSYAVFDDRAYSSSTSPQPIIVHFLDYSATDKQKAMIVRANGLAVDQIIGRWASTSAITSLSINNYGTNFTAGSTFSLYGVSA